jgi:hypothetical protein
MGQSSSHVGSRMAAARPSLRHCTKRPARALKALDMQGIIMLLLHTTTLLSLQRLVTGTQHPLIRGGLRKRMLQRSSPLF